MNRFILAGILCSALALLNGCCSANYHIDPAPRGAKAPAGYEAVAVGTATNTGYFLFNALPLYTGHPGWPNQGEYQGLRDNVKPHLNSEMLLRGMQKHYKAEKLMKVEHSQTAWGYFSLWIVWKRSISTEAVGIRKIRPRSKAKK